MKLRRLAPESEMAKRIINPLLQMSLQRRFV
jgi:hypothetical protein